MIQFQFNWNKIRLQEWVQELEKKKKWYTNKPQCESRKYNWIGKEILFLFEKELDGQGKWNLACIFYGKHSRPLI